MSGMASGTSSPSGLDTTSSLENALDQAIARRYGAASERGGKKRRNTPTAWPPAMRVEMARTPTERLPRLASTALAVPSRETALTVPAPRLRWKGIEVSDEFQEYAARVARGEQLEPYRGPVLSQPTPEFPWNVAHERLSLPPERASRVSQRLSLAPMAMSVAPPGAAESAAVYPERGRPLKTALSLGAAITSIVAALGFGAGATSSAANDFRVVTPAPGAIDGRPAAARDETLGSDLGQAPERVEGIGERQLDSLAAAQEAANRANGEPASSEAPRTPPRLSSASQASALRARPVAAPRSAAPASAPRLSIPQGAALPVTGGLSRGAVTSARPLDSSKGLDSGDLGSLFSDRPSF